MNANSPVVTNAVSTSAGSNERPAAGPISSLSGLGTVVYRIGVLSLLAAIAWPQIGDRLGALPAASAVEQSGFRLGPSRNSQRPAAPPTPTPANPPSALLSKHDWPTYGDAYPGYEDMLPRNLNGVPIVYVVNLPYLQGGRLDTLRAAVQGTVSVDGTVSTR